MIHSKRRGLMSYGDSLLAFMAWASDWILFWKLVSSVEENRDLWEAVTQELAHRSKALLCYSGSRQPSGCIYFPVVSPKSVLADCCCYAATFCVEPDGWLKGKAARSFVYPTQTPFYIPAPMPKDYDLL